MTIKDIVSNIEIPKKWKDVLLNSLIEPLLGGQSDMDTYKVLDENGENLYVLKLTTCPTGISNLKYEVQILTMLEDKSFAPKSYVSIFTSKIGLSLREYFDGKPIDACGLKAEEMVAICSRLMKTIHTTNIDAGVLKTYQTRLEEAEFNINNGLVDEKDFEEDCIGFSASDLYKRFLGLECILDATTFTHGDFSFPNIIYSGTEAKLIDWGTASISDKYQDISLLIRELRRWSDAEALIKLIEESYEIDHIEDIKINKFILLDEFF